VDKVFAKLQRDRRTKKNENKESVSSTRLTFKMSYAYLFKYIIIGDTGKAFFCEISPDAWIVRVWCSQSVWFFVLAILQHVCMLSLLHSHRQQVAFLHTCCVLGEPRFVFWHNGLVVGYRSCLFSRLVILSWFCLPVMSVLNTAT
jgi:hypothetical protein